MPPTNGQKLDRIVAALAELNTSVSVEIATNKQQHEYIVGKLESLDEKAGQQNGRVRSLEQWKWRLLGGWAVLTLAGSAYFIFQ